MGSERNLHDDQNPEISLYEGGDGFCCIRTFLAREPSLNQSFDLFYRESEAGIPFKWETQPGTPKEYIYPQQDGLMISTPTPLSPSPLMQSLKLRLPYHDDIKGSTLKSSKVESFKKMVQKSIAFNRDIYHKGCLRFGQLMDSSVVSSSSFPIPRKDRGLDSSIQSAPRPGDGGEKHKESAWTKKALFWIKDSRKTQNFDQEISFRCPENTEILDSDDSLLRNMSKSSTYSSEINRNFEARKMKGASYFSCGSWKGMKRDSCVCSKQI